MGMTIDTAITVLDMVEAHGVCIEAKEIAVETMHKYQKIEQIMEDYQRYPMDCLFNVREVLEDGNK